MFFSLGPVFFFLLFQKKEMEREKKMKSEGRVAAEPFIFPLPPSLLFFFFFSRARAEGESKTNSLSRAHGAAPGARRAPRSPRGRQEGGRGLPAAAAVRSRDDGALEGEQGDREALSLIDCHAFFLLLSD